MSKVQRFVDEIINDRKIHPICERCGHGKDQHAFDIYPMPNPKKLCELSCTICFQEETDRLEAEEREKK